MDDSKKLDFTGLRLTADLFKGLTNAPIALTVSPKGNIIYHSGDYVGGCSARLVEAVKAGQVDPAKIQFAEFLDTEEDGNGNKTEVTRYIADYDPNQFLVI